MTLCDDNPTSVRQLATCYFDDGKFWWRLSLAFKFIAFVLGLVAIWSPQAVVWIAGASAVCLFTAEACGMRSNSRRSIAEGLHRKLDFHNSFGWPISELEIADAEATMSARARKRLVDSQLPDDYFASTNPPGPRRGMENLLESSWWSKHLARSLTKICVTATIGLTVISLLMLLASYSFVSSTEPLVSISRVVISLLLLIVSLGLIPLAMNYHAFADKSKKSEIRAANLLQSDAVDSEQAIKAFNEYHLARATAPLIPTFLWKLKRQHLNKTWSQFVGRRSHGTA